MDGAVQGGQGGLNLQGRVPEMSQLQRQREKDRDGDGEMEVEVEGSL